MLRLKLLNPAPKIAQGRIPAIFAVCFIIIAACAIFRALCSRRFLAQFTKSPNSKKELVICLALGGVADGNQSAACQEEPEEPKNLKRMLRFGLRAGGRETFLGFGVLWMLKGNAGGKLEAKVWGNFNVF